ncbi:MAG: DUF4493 domain-containing protein [Alistipes sp.]|nr:DUF4493 domain-containing protein [Alistipes sp.]
MRKLLLFIGMSALSMACSSDAATSDDSSSQGLVTIACSTTNEITVTRTDVNCTIPTAEEFSLRIEGISLQYDSSWQTIAAFNADNYLNAGSYKAVVEAGDITEEGYDKATFRGEQTFTVAAREQTSVDIKAYIANSLVKVDLTDNFRRYFTGGWQLTLTTAAGNSFDVSTPSDQPIFMAPESFSITGKATKQPNTSGGSGIEVVLPEMSRDRLAAQTLYTVTFDVSTAGGATLEILLDDTPVESITIDNELNDNAQ